MIFALSTGHEIGLAIVGGAFITFSLVSAFVLPRVYPDFPGRKGMLWYIPLCFCFFAAMISAVLVFGKAAPANVANAAATASTSPASTTSTTPSGANSGKLTSGPYANGDPTVGKATFTGKGGCGACHTLTAAGTSGTIGPNLDNIASYAMMAKVPLEQFIVDAITKPPAPYVPPGFAHVMPTTFATTLSSSEIAGLVAFIAGSAK
jgi:mono/diheme cytochrome c family protein